MIITMKAEHRLQAHFYDSLVKRGTEGVQDITTASFRVKHTERDSSDDYKNSLFLLVLAC